MPQGMESIGRFRSYELLEVSLEFAVSRSGAFGEDQRFTHVEFEIRDWQLGKGGLEIVHEVVFAAVGIDSDPMSSEKFQLAVEASLVEFQFSKQSFSPLWAFRK